VIRGEHDTARRGHEVEARVLELQRLDVADAIVDVEPAFGGPSLRLINQRRSDVHAGDLGARQGGELRYCSRSAGEVE
jgi:hypothetical protein